MNNIYILLISIIYVYSATLCACRRIIKDALSHSNERTLTMPGAARSKAWVCGLTLAGIAGSNPAVGMDICASKMLCVVRCLCDGLITRPE